MDGRGAGARRRITAALGTAALTVGGMLLGASPASAATTATFNPAGGGVLSVIGDNLDNVIGISRDAAGTIRVNGGAVGVAGGSPTVANTGQIQVFGLGGADRVVLSESFGALPRANLLGGAGDDVLTGSAGSDLLFGQAGADQLQGGGGTDQLFGGDGADQLSGGEGDDTLLGEAGDDLLRRNIGGGSDVDEGGDGTDTVEVNSDDRPDTFTVSANGAKVRVDQVAATPSHVDIGTAEKLTLRTRGGDDRIDASGSPAGVPSLTVDAGPGADVLHGGDGPDVLLGGDGNDVVEGRSGADAVLLGAGDDTFTWNPDEGNDTVEGQEGGDRVVMNGSSASEHVDLSANGTRVRLFRDVANVNLDVDGVETVAVDPAGGADEVSVQNLAGSAVRDVVADLGLVDARPPDGAPDTVRVAGTAAADSVDLTGAFLHQEITGLTARVTVLRADRSPTDRLVVAVDGGDDTVRAPQLGVVGVTVDGGDGSDVLRGGQGDDTLLGGVGDDVLLGGPGRDTLDGGPGEDVLLEGEVVTDGTVATRAFLGQHARTRGGDTVLDVGGRQLVVPGVTAESLAQSAAA